ncbi:MAG: class I SAM-dependent methyltransferase [Parcubacteria group bacterium]|nr:class I SAM-dependent methyltransferase [Parcubacteria group bacterium]
MFINPERIIESFDITPKMFVADIGSGAGFYTIPIARAVGPSGRVYAVDVRREMLELVQNNARRAGLHNIQTVVADLEEPSSISLPDASVHAAVLANILFQIEHKDALAEETRRIIKQGGTVYIIDWIPPEMEDRQSAPVPLGPPKSSRIGKKTVRELFAAHALVFKKEFNAGLHHYGLAFQKTS